MTSPSLRRRIDSPVGPIELVCDGTHLTELTLCGHSARHRTFGGDASRVLDRAERQIAEYFAGTRREFDLPLAPSGTAFQRSVWAELTRIPFGATSSYGAIAAAVGKPAGARAVGGAVGSNPIALIIPCHRVLASDRRLTGYSGGDGVDTKMELLDLEHIEYRA